MCVCVCVLLYYNEIHVLTFSLSLSLFLYLSLSLALPDKYYCRNILELFPQYYEWKRKYSKSNLEELTTSFKQQLSTNPTSTSILDKRVELVCASLAQDCFSKYLSLSLSVRVYL